MKFINSHSQPFYISLPVFQCGSTVFVTGNQLSFQFIGLPYDCLAVMMDLLNS